MSTLNKENVIRHYGIMGLIQVSNNLENISETNIKLYVKILDKYLEQLDKDYNELSNLLLNSTNRIEFYNILDNINNIKNVINSKILLLKNINNISNN